MSPCKSAAGERRAARRNWRVIKVSLSDSDGSDGGLPPEAALGMMWQLALDAWSMTGRAIPDYPRSRVPIRRLSIREA